MSLSAAAAASVNDMVNQKWRSLQRAARESQAEGGWSELARERGVVVCARTAPGSSMRMMRGTGLVPVPPIVVLNMAFDLKNRPNWDPMFETGHRLEKINDSTSVTYLQFKGKWPAQPRDMVAASGYRPDGRGAYYIVANSVTHPAMPERSGFTRATITDSGFAIEPHPENPNETLLTYVAQVNYNGWVPAAVAKLVSRNQPMVVASLRDYIMERVQDDPSLLRITTEPIIPDLNETSAPAPTTNAGAPSAAAVAPAPTSGPANSAVAAAEAAAATRAAAAAAQPPSSPDAADGEASDEPGTLESDEPAGEAATARPPSGRRSRGALSTGIEEAAAQNTRQLVILQTAVTNLLKTHEAMSKQVVSMLDVLKRSMSMEQRFRDVESRWDSRLSRLEGTPSASSSSAPGSAPARTFAAMTSWRSVNWLQVLQALALIIGWPIVANLLWNLVQGFRRRR